MTSDTWGFQTDSECFSYRVQFTSIYLALKRLEVLEAIEVVFIGHGVCFICVPGCLSTIGNLGVML